MRLNLYYINTICLRYMLTTNDEFFVNQRVETSDSVTDFMTIIDKVLSILIFIIFCFVSSLTKINSKRNIS